MKEILFFTIFVFLLIPNALNAQNLKSERGLHQNILKVLKDGIQDKYYDANFGGIKIEEQYKLANDSINSATSGGQMMNIIAGFLFQFEDSHLFFLPPAKTIKIEYGWEMAIVGDKAFVSKVDAESDAAQKGVKVGDQIYMVEGFIPRRTDFWKLRYQFEVLNPQPSLNVILIKPSGNKYRVELKAKVTENKVLYYYHDFDSRNFLIEEQITIGKETKQLTNDKISGLFIWKLPSFEISTTAINKIFDRASKSKALILDLRGNDEFSALFWKSRVRLNRMSGFIPAVSRNRDDTLESDDAYLKTLTELIGNLFNKEINVGERRKRKEVKELTAKPRGKDYFSGQIVVLIDGETGSASEILARIIQLEKRGKVIGDQSAGTVMETKFYSYEGVIDLNTPYGMNISTADIVMSDGRRLEKVGVTPDEKLLPTAFDFVNNRDPVMARAVKILGFELTPEQAAKIFDEKK